MPSLPTLVIPRVYHIGTLNPGDRGAHGDSLEGHALSVSCCPHAWQSIARIGGNPWWQLDRPEARFLDIHALRDDARTLGIVIAWGLRRSLIESRPLWRAWTTDEEGDWRYSLHTTQDEARAEVEPLDNADAPRGHRTVEPLPTWTGTPALAQRMGRQSLALVDAIDFLSLALVEDTQAGVDGLWWKEIYAPESLSAPRGGILPSRLDQWRRQSIQPGHIEDCEDPMGRARSSRRLAPHKP